MMSVLQYGDHSTLTMHVLNYFSVRNIFSRAGEVHSNLIVRERPIPSETAWKNITTALTSSNMTN